MATFAPGHLRRLRVENAETVARIEKKTTMMRDWTNVQLAAATAAGQRLVLQPQTNLNNHVGGVAAHVGMRVQANPAFFETYSSSVTEHTDYMRWGMSRGKGTVVGTCDDKSELRVRWDDDIREGCNIKAGKRGDYWIMTA